ncbi:MAG: hypothetical protein JWQ27_573 [Ferruginibacter sp.]|nr:hypothetical protein [Ferruginibacter sp.]
MTSALIDIGDGHGNWQPADPAHKRTIIFGADSSFQDTDNPELKNYRLKDAEHIVVSGGSNSFQMTVVSLTADSLHLRPQCIEGCGEKFRRMK